MDIKRFIIPALRNIKVDKTSFFMNIASLVVGFTSITLIAFWIKHELTYDNFHSNANNTYRIAYTGVLSGKEIKDATTPKVFNEALSKYFPEVETATIIFNFDEALVSKENGEAFRVKLSGINPNFFDVFTVPVIEGDINDLLKPNTTFITREMSKKFFGDTDPIGKTISTGMDRENKKFTIVGLVEKLPENSHFDFDMLYSNASMSWYNSESNNWLDANFHNYVVLKPNTNYKAFEKKFNDYTLERIGPIIKRWQNLSIEEWYAKGEWVYFVFQPIKMIHLSSSFDSEYKQSGDITYIYIFLIVGILILLISIINFSNLSTVKSFGRSKEIGIRKVSGSNRRSLIIQFLIESCLLSMAALFISIVLVVLISPYYQNLTNIKIWPGDILKWWVFTGLLFMAVLAGLLAGAFPAFYLSKLSAIKVLSSSSKIRFKDIFIKDILIVAQFVISIIVIIGTFLISKQLNYLQNENLGFKKENILVLKGTENLSWKKNILLNQELQKIVTIKETSSSHFVPNDDCSYYSFKYESQRGQEFVIIDVLPCDENFQKVYLFELLRGRFFPKFSSGNTRKIVLNEKAAHSLDTGDCVGKTITRGGTDYEIIGIVKDFHYSSKRSEIPPLGFVQLPDLVQFWSPMYCSVRMHGDNIQATVADIKEVWDKVSPGTEFSYSFFDQDYDMLYKQEMQAKKVFIILSFIAIILSCFGLLGFVKYQVQTRIKEIGIRKVNGAKISEILTLLNKDFVRWIAIAFVIACPVAFYAMIKWLENFAYKTELSWWIFGLAGILALGIALLTVSWQSWKAATKNPVEALRYE
jgi:putative ABC transport system permease protein